MIVYGGDPGRLAPMPQRVLGDVWILHMHGGGRNGTQAAGEQDVPAFPWVWERVHPQGRPPQARSRHGFAMYDVGRMIIYGGTNVTAHYGDIVAKTALPGSTMGNTVLRDSAILHHHPTGGENGTWMWHSEASDTFTIATEWNGVNQSSPARAGHVMTVINHTALLVYGGFDEYAHWSLGNIELLPRNVWCLYPLLGAPGRPINTRGESREAHRYYNSGRGVASMAEIQVPTARAPAVCVGWLTYSVGHQTLHAARAS